MAILKPRPQPPALPRDVVIVPRAAFAAWVSAPWSEVWSAAGGGVDGMRRATEAERNAVTTPADTAQLREGAGHWGKDRTMLYKQGW
jgi:hypothetical protein